MKTELKRRDFISKCFKAGATGSALLYGNSLFAQDPVKLKKEDLKDLTYCCYKCTSECPTYKATIENNPELKKKVYEDAKWKEKYGIDFDTDKVFCFGCKSTDKPLSINVKACTVRKCAIEKGYDCCIECNGLTACDKDLWKSYPDFKANVIEFQKSYSKS
jgi:anaerobic selenocysteine-containing dehydrogenase